MTENSPLLVVQSLPCFALHRGQTKLMGLTGNRSLLSIERLNDITLWPRKSKIRQYSESGRLDIRIPSQYNPAMTHDSSDEELTRESELKLQQIRIAKTLLGQLTGDAKTARVEELNQMLDSANELLIRRAEKAEKQVESSQMRIMDLESQIRQHQEQIRQHQEQLHRLQDRLARLQTET